MSVAEQESCPQAHYLDKSSLGRLPEEKGFHCHFRNQSGSFKKGRFYLVVDEGVRHSFHSQMRAAFQDWCCLAPHKATGGLCQEDLIWTKNEAGWGELSKIRNKKLRHKSKPGWGVARRPGAAARNSAFHLASPPVMAAILCLAPQGPVSPLVSTISSSMEGLAEVVSERETGVRKSCEKALSEGSKGRSGNRPNPSILPDASRPGF